LIHRLLLASLTPRPYLRIPEEGSRIFLSATCSVIRRKLESQRLKYIPWPRG
jgi:hypothetical protein